MSKKKETVDMDMIKTKKITIITMDNLDQMKMKDMIGGDDDFFFLALNSKFIPMLY